MKISRPTRDRLIAAISVVLILGVVFGTVLLAKNSKSYTVTYYDGDTVLKVETVKKDETAKNWRPDDTQSGRLFECWVTEDGQEYDFGLPVTEDLKLYAKWY